MSEEAAVADLKRSGIKPADAERAGMGYADNARKVCVDFARAPALSLPYLDPLSGEPMLCPNGREFVRVRYLDEVRNHEGKLVRYAQPRNSGVRAYFPAVIDWPSVFKDPSWPICITEGEKKSLALCLQDVATIGLGGVWNWREDGKLLPELEMPNWQDRCVIIVYDSDAATNSQVRIAELTLAAELQRRGADVRLCRLDPSEDGAKRGVDDYIATGATRELLTLLTNCGPLQTVEQDVLDLNREAAYLESEDCVYVIAENRKLSKSAFLKGSSFSARTTAIVRSIKGKPVESIAPLAPIWLQHPAARRYSDTVFNPATPEREIHTEKGTLLNRWHGLHGIPGDVTPWLELTDYLLSNSPPDVKELVVNLLAYKAQNPHIKVPLARVFIGAQGCGKSLWCRISAQAFEPYYFVIPSKALKSDFQPFMETALAVVIDEAQAVHIEGARDKLKGLISEQRQEMNKKHVSQVQIDTYCQFDLTSNDRRVGSFDRDDRRMIVIDCPPPREKAFYEKVVAWDKAGGSKHLLHWLQTYDLAGWTPPQTAPLTAEKHMAYMENLSPVQRLAEEMQTADFNIVKMWIDNAVVWAQAAANGGQPGDAKLGKEIIAALGTVQMRPFYTPDELAMMFPAIVGQLHGNRKMEVTPSGEISRQLRNFGIPYLRCADDVKGFKWRGRYAQFLIVADRQEWSVPILQADFERYMREFPTYREAAARALQNTRKSA